MNNWVPKILNDVADIKLSNVDKKTKEDERIIRLCNYTDVYNNSFINNDRSQSFMIASCNEKEYEKFKLKKGQVAITKDSETPNDIGVPTYISNDFQDVVLGYHLSLITPNTEKLNGHFLYYWLNTKQAKRYFENNAGGSGQRCTLPIDIIKSIPLHLPNTQIQESIAKVLSDLDEKIELNNKINQELEAMAKTLYDYWFVQFDFPDENGKPYKSSGGKMVYNEELKREIPEGWEVDVLVKNMDVQYGFPYSTKLFNNDKIGKPVIRIRDILESTISLYSTEVADEKYQIRKGALLIGMDGNFHMNFWDKENCFLNQRCVKLEPKNKKSISTFQALFDTQPYIKAREKNVSRTTVGHLSARDINDLKIIKATESIQLQANETFNGILNKVLSNRTENQQLTTLRDWLLPMLMNGQVTVN